MRFVLAAALVALVAPPALGQFSDPDQLGRVRSIGVAEAVETDADGHHCEPHAGALQTEAELVLRSAGIPVEPHDSRNFAQHKFLLSVLMVGAPGPGCAVSYRFDLWRWEAVVDAAALIHDAAPRPTTGLVTAFVSSGVWFGGVHRIKDRLREDANAAATLLANEILKARGE